MSGEKKRRVRKKGIFIDYVVYILSFLVVSLAAVIAVLFIAEKPVTEIVHKIEKQYEMQVRDITVNIDGSYQDCEPDEYDVSSPYGDKIGNITIESCGVNSDIYYGSNRASMRYGVGFVSDDYDLDNGSGVKVIKGYDETYFSGLKYAGIGDIVKINTSLGETEYRVADAKYIGKDTEPYNSKDINMLVLCSIPSDFSEHGGERYYVFAEKIDGEGN